MAEGTIQQELEIAADHNPVCPHCKMDPAFIAMRGPILLGTNKKVVIFFCANPDCRKVWNCQMIGLEQARLFLPQAAAAIAKP